MKRWKSVSQSPPLACCIIKQPSKHVYFELLSPGGNMTTDVFFLCQVVVLANRSERDKTSKHQKDQWLHRVL